MTLKIDENFTERLGYLEPPGCMVDTILHPLFRDETIEVALFPEHRFAFYYWLKWTNNNKFGIPSLVTYDWHQDLSPPYDDELPELRALNDKDRGEVALYTWGKLSHHNDVQIRAALLLNKLKDVYAICRQDVGRPDRETILDFYGNEHNIHIFRDPLEFDAYLPNIQDQKIYFDIDLDYFTYVNPTSMKGPFKGSKYTYMTKANALSLFSVENPTIQWILKRIAGFTIATEPEFCGGLKKSNEYLKLLDTCYFTPSLFYKELQWKGTDWKDAVLEQLYV